MLREGVLILLCEIEFAILLYLVRCWASYNVVLVFGLVRYGQHSVMYATCNVTVVTLVIHFSLIQFLISSRAS